MSAPQAEPAVGVFGLRTFQVSVDGTLLPIGSQSSCWAGGTCIAECLSGATHQAPDDDCTCGVYSFRSLRELRGQYRRSAQHVVAVVELSGQTIQGERGYRSQAGRVVALWLHRDALPGPVRSALLCGLSEVPMFDSVTEMIESFPGLSVGGPVSTPNPSPVPTLHSAARQRLDTGVRAALQFGDRCLGRAGIVAVGVSAATVVTGVQAQDSLMAGTLDDAGRVVDNLAGIAVNPFTTQGQPVAGPLTGMFCALVVIGLVSSLWAHLVNGDREVLALRSFALPIRLARWIAGWVVGSWIGLCLAHWVTGQLALVQLRGWQGPLSEVSTIPPVDGKWVALCVVVLAAVCTGQAAGVRTFPLIRRAKVSTGVAMRGTARARAVTFARTPTGETVRTFPALMPITVTGTQDTGPVSDAQGGQGPHPAG